jgi:CRISPR-associated protein Cas5t
VPVGEVSKKHKPMTKGNKHHIALASRGLLTTFCGVCAVDADPTLETLLTTQLDAPSPKLSCGSPRYGLPFLGDNNFFLEELSLIKPDPTEVDWLVNEKGPAPFRLTVAVDRAGISNTRQRDFTLQPGPLHSPPPSAWVQVGPRP